MCKPSKGKDNDPAASSLCVNCVDPCLGTVVASSSSIPLLLTDHDVFHGLVVSMLPRVLAPAIQDMYVIGVDINTLFIGVDTLEPSLVYCLALGNQAFPVSEYEVVSDGVLNMTQLGLTPSSFWRQHATFMFENLNSLYSYRVTCVTMSIEGNIMSFERMKR